MTTTASTTTQFYSSFASECVLCGTPLKAPHPGVPVRESEWAGFDCCVRCHDLAVTHRSAS